MATEPTTTTTPGEDEVDKLVNELDGIGSPAAPGVEIEATAAPTYAAAPAPAPVDVASLPPPGSETEMLRVDGAAPPALGDDAAGEKHARPGKARSVASTAVSTVIQHASMKERREQGRLTATFKCYRMFFVLLIILIGTPLLFPPEVAQLPFPMQRYTSIRIELASHDCDVILKPFPGFADSDWANGNMKLNVFGDDFRTAVDEEEDSMIRQNGDGFTFLRVKGTGLNYVCRVILPIPDSDAAAVDVSVIASSTARIFATDVVAGVKSLDVSTSHNDAFVQMSLQKFRTSGSGGVQYAATAGRVHLHDLTGNARINLEDRGQIEISSKHASDAYVHHHNGEVCFASSTMSDRNITTTTPFANGTKAYHHMHLFPTAVTTAAVPSQSIHVTHNGQGPVHVSVFSHASILLQAGDVYRAAGFGSPGSSTTADGRSVSIGGFAFPHGINVFEETSLELATMNVSGPATPTGVFLWSRRALWFQLLPPVLNVLTGGVLRPKQARAEGFAFVCPLVPSKCNGDGVCVATLSSAKPVAVDPFYRYFKDEFVEDDDRPESLVAIQARALDPYLIKEERSGKACLAALPDREKDPLYPVDVRVESPRLCMLDQGIDSDENVLGSCALSGVVALGFTLVAVLFIIVVVQERAANTFRVKLILSTAETRSLAREVMEESKRFGFIKHPRDQGCCSCAGSGATVAAATDDPDHEEWLFFPNDVRLNCVWHPPSREWRPCKIWDIANLEFVGKLEHIFQRVVVDRLGTVWGPPYGLNGAWQSARTNGRLVQMTGPPLSGRPSQVQFLRISGNFDEEMHKSTIFSEDAEQLGLTDLSLARCHASCADKGFEGVDPKQRSCIPCGATVRYFPLHDEDHCASVAKEFEAFRVKLEKFMRLIWYVNNMTSPFALIEQLFPNDEMPGQLHLQNMITRATMCVHCKEIKASVACKVNRERGLCRRCFEVLHYKPDGVGAGGAEGHLAPLGEEEEVKHEQINLVLGPRCQNCDRTDAKYACSHESCITKRVWKLCERCDTVLHKEGGHHREEIVLCDVCSTEPSNSSDIASKFEAPKERKSRHDHSGFQIGPTGVVTCSDCGGRFCIGCHNDLHMPSQAGGGGEWDPEFPGVMQAVYYQLCHSLKWELLVVVTHVLLVVIPTAPLLAVAGNLETAFEDMYGPSLGPSGHIISTTTTVFMAWSSVFWFVSAGMLGLYYFLPTEYEPRLNVKRAEEMNRVERLLFALTNSRIIMSFARLQKSTAARGHLFKFIYASRVLYFIFFCLTFGPSLAYIILVGLWVLLGLFISPVQVAPYATGVLLLVGHIYITYAKGVSFLKAVHGEVKSGMQAMRDEDYEGGMGDPVSDYEVAPWLEGAGISMQNVAVKVIGSTVVLILVFLFIFLGLSSFSNDSEVQAVVNSVVCYIAATIVEKLSDTGADEETVAKAGRKILVKIMQAKKKEEFQFNLAENLDDMLGKAGHFYKDI